ncbi:hypothetical protein KNU91_gp011 [Enterococcus phage nattely]|uniref:Uncharacterized protein n=1 Tax=Enterococcus phage nattely TaxID=2719593 RepID=A0A6G9LKY3_9CAUD|nr:hypothetical protein KNU91_gp011 [Enterococcus phage nattely]QIQ66178.1 hypothetical protein nattely_11 [Enterococcus phage nattely]
MFNCDYEMVMKREFNYLLQNGKLSDWALKNLPPSKKETLFNALEAKIDGEATANGLSEIIEHK